MQHTNESNTTNSLCGACPFVGMWIVLNKLLSQKKNSLELAFSILCINFVCV